MKFRKAAQSLALSGIALCCTIEASASGFQIWEQNAGSVGDYHAGAIANADSAGDEFYNPAQTTHFKKEVISVGIAYIPLRVKFAGNIGYTAPPSSSTNGYEKSNTNGFVPNLHFILPLSPKMAFSFGVETPFGLSTEYRDVAPVNQAATETQLKTINFNPNIAYRFGGHLSLSVGFDAMYGTATYNNSPLPPLETYFHNELKGWGYGYNLGMLLDVSPKTRVGVAYRSRVTLKADGPSTSNLASSTLDATFPLPAILSMGMSHQLNARWSVMGAVFRTYWHVFDELKLNNTANGNVIVHENYRDTWNVALGAHYCVNERWLLKVGVGYDQTPTQYGYRDIRLPDVSHFSLAVGARYAPRKNLSIDFGVLHLFLPKTAIDNTLSKGTAHELLPFAQGTARSQINVYGIQLEQKF